MANGLSFTVGRVEDHHLGEDIRSLADVHILLGFFSIVTDINIKDFSVVVKNWLDHLVKCLEYLLV